MDSRQKTWVVRGALAVAVLLLAMGAWQRFGARDGDEGLASGNGRIEAVEVDIAARSSGRLRELLVAEGDFVTRDQVVARLDTDVLEAQRRQADAQQRQAESAIATARSQLAQRESDLAAARAGVAQREVELEAARTQHARTAALAEKGFVSPQAADDTRTRVDAARAAVVAAQAQVAAADAAIATARTQIDGAASNAGAAKANVERIQADIDEAVLRAPRDGRVQYLVAQAGEVVAAGGRVVNMLDLSDVSMTFFLPTTSAGRVALGAEARIVLDAAPQYVLPATIAFVASEAQFTPKTVETKVEREKLMFRVKARLPPDLLRKHIRQVKTGLPGVAYVKLDAAREWPARLQVKLPP